MHDDSTVLNKVLHIDEAKNRNRKMTLLMLPDLIREVQMAGMAI